MEFLVELWLPILLSAVFVFIASTILHMLLPIHKGDYRKLPGEESVLAAMREQGVQPGEYMFPRTDSMKDMCSPEMVEKFRKGPVGFVTIKPSGDCSMAKGLIQWFVYSLLVSVFAAYIAANTLHPGDPYLSVFRITGAVAFVAYAFAYIQNSIWKGVPWCSTFKYVFDGLIYGLVTAGAFGWLWPAAQQ